MNDQSDRSGPGLFGYLATQLAVHPENIATEALAYVLRTSSPVARAFEEYLRRIAPIPPGLHYVTQATGDDGSIPDLAGVAADGSTPVLLEAKFWAGLTENQPVSYLRRLPDGGAGALLFVVPSTRLELLWTEVISRADTAGMNLVSRETEGEYRHAQAGFQGTLGMTSWRSLLTFLADAATSAGDLAARSDLDQLAGLCSRMDSEAFIPLRAEDLTGSVAVRLMQYSDLINKVVDRLVTLGHASTKTAGGALHSTSGAGYSGRYFAMGNVICLLRFSASHWARDRATPVWLQIGYRGQPSVAATLTALTAMRGERNRVFPRSNFVDVAIDLPINVEADAVVADMVRQVLVVAGHLASLVTVAPVDVVPESAE